MPCSNKTWTLKSWPLSWLTRAASLRGATTSGTRWKKEQAWMSFKWRQRQFPRTLAITALGKWMHVYPGEIPRGRQPIKTSWVREQNGADFNFVGTSNSRRATSVYDFATDWRESGFYLDVQNAEEIYRMISAHFSDRVKVGLLHGKMPKLKKKKAVMADFKLTNYKYSFQQRLSKLGWTCRMPGDDFGCGPFGLAQLAIAWTCRTWTACLKRCIWVASPKTENGKRMRIMWVDGWILS